MELFAATNRTKTIICPRDEIVAACETRMAPCYSILSRGVACLGGLILLYRCGRDFRPAETAETLDRLCQNFDEAVAGLRSITPPGPLRGTHDDLLAAATAARAALLRVRGSLSALGGGIDVAETALSALNAAHRLLRKHHDVNSGMQMLDLEHACGLCGNHH